MNDLSIKSYKKADFVEKNKKFKFALTDRDLILKIKEIIKKYNYEDLRPVFVCVGSDLVVGDCLGPLVGTMLKNIKGSPYVYGSLNMPVTAKEVNSVGKYMIKTHKKSFIIAIDAGVGIRSDVGKIVVSGSGLKPGLGVNKKLEDVGDLSIVGVVAEKTPNNTKLFNYTRLNLIYNMATAITEGLSAYLTYYKDKCRGISIFSHDIDKNKIKLAF